MHEPRGPLSELPEPRGPPSEQPELRGLPVDLPELHDPSWQMHEVRGGLIEQSENFHLVVQETPLGHALSTKSG